MVLRVRDLEVRRLREARFISTGFYRDSIGADEVKKIVLENDSDYELYVSNITVRAKFRSRVSKAFNVSVDTDADNLGFTNKKSTGGDSVVNDLSAFTAGDGEPGAVSGGDGFNDKLLPAGAGVSPGAVQGAGGNVLAEGDNMVVGVENLDGSGGIVSIDVDFVKLTN